MLSPAAFMAEYRRAPKAVRRTVNRVARSEDLRLPLHQLPDADTAVRRGLLAIEGPDVVLASAHYFALAPMPDEPRLLRLSLKIVRDEWVARACARMGVAPQLTRPETLAALYAARMARPWRDGLSDTEARLYETLAGTKVVPEQRLADPAARGLADMLLLLPVYSGFGELWLPLAKEALPLPRPAPAPAVPDRVETHDAVAEAKRILLMLPSRPVRVTQDGRPHKTDVARLAATLGWREDLVMQRVLVAMGAGLLRRGERLAAGDCAADFDSGAPKLRDATRNMIDFVSVGAPVEWYLAEEIRKRSAEVLLALGGEFVPAEEILERTLARIPRQYAARFLGRGFDALADGASTLACWMCEAGLIDLQFAGDKIAGARASAWGRLKGFAPAPPPAKFVVQPSLEIVAPFESPFADLLRLADVAEARKVDVVVTFELSRASVARAVKAGVDLAAWKTFLADRATAALPGTVTVLLDEFAARAGEVQIRRCSAVIEVRDAAILKMLLADAKLAPSLRAIGERAALVAPGVNPQEVRDRAEKLGYLVEVPRPAPAPAMDRRSVSDVLSTEDFVEVRMKNGTVVEGWVTDSDRGGAWIEGELSVGPKYVRYDDVASVQAL